MTTQTQMSSLRLAKPKPDFLRSSGDLTQPCGTDAKKGPMVLTQDAMQLDIYDSSSDDGDSLQTPVSDSAHVVQIAFNGSSPVLQHTSKRATANTNATSTTHHPAREKPQNLLLERHERENESSFAPFSAHALPLLANLHHLPPATASTQQPSPSSSHSTSFSLSSTSEEFPSSPLSFASSTSSTDFRLSALCSPSSLLDSGLSFEGLSSGSSDLAPLSLDLSFSSTSTTLPSSTLPGSLRTSPMKPFSSSRYAPPPSSPLAQSFSASQLEAQDSPIDDSGSPTPIQTESRSSTQARKRLPDPQTPLTNTRPGQKPKLSRSFASEYLPSTLGRSYSSRFSPDHRLRADFVREYALDGELGKGGYGFVMAAKHRRDGYEVAVKFITKAKIPPVSWSVDDCGRPVPKEARLLSQLDHPGIVKFLDLFEDEVYFYLVQELHGSPWVRKKSSKFVNGPQSSIDQQTSTDENQPPLLGHAHLQFSRSPQQNVLGLQGMGKVLAPTKFTSGLQPPMRPSPIRRASHDLFECIESTKNKRFTEEDAKYIFAQVVDVVIYLDQNGIAHSDIKDENVVIDSELKIKLIDFGSGIIYEPAQPPQYHRRFYGTSAFAAPEIVTNKQWQTGPAEVFALGMLLSYLMRGASPFPTDADKLQGHVVLDEKSRKRLSEGCVSLMRRCLVADPRRRATVLELRDDPWLRDGFLRMYAVREEEEERERERMTELELEMEASMVGVRGSSPEL